MSLELSRVLFCLLHEFGANAFVDVCFDPLSFFTLMKDLFYEKR
jgi:hypothetical protein